ncbi:hypothetical protein C4573_01505 [Candidatus Woesearchaeota archaeon]|nr:MAG: hypothetical protein C4573_01505 [Candidatus Woesearchaeota archaeon]
MAKEMLVFERDTRSESIGEKIGFACAYILFTTILFFILLLLKKLPASWTYLHVAAITAGIAILAFIVRKTVQA